MNSVRFTTRTRGVGESHNDGEYHILSFFQRNLSCRMFRIIIRIIISFIFGGGIRYGSGVNGDRIDTLANV